jgi:predicted acylesterase/phospholipase RssA
MRVTLLLVATALVLAGCASLERNPVPAELVATASIPGLPDIRAVAGVENEAMQRDLARSFAQESEEDFPPGADGFARYPLLAISGGGANGAFGAGFLNGWTTTGKRPVFKIVTGVSTGALMAPFVFLGPDYDGTLRDFYTTTRSEDIFVRGSLLRRLLSGESLADTGPLQVIIARIVDETLLRKVADAHQRGRRLYVGTTNLDTQQFMVWNMGMIATSGHPDALELFRKVMLASASIPVAFPPVYFEVEAGGQRYDEMHVDGAVTANTFVTAGVYRPSLARSQASSRPGRDDLFVIHNGQLFAKPSPTKRTVRSIALRSMEAASRSGMLDELIRIYAFTLREEAGYAWVGIPQGINLTGGEIFDPAVMRELFELGYQRALGGPEWSALPPGFGSVEEWGLQPRAPASPPVRE